MTPAGAQLAENSHPGFRPRKRAFASGPTRVKSKSASGIRSRLRREDVGPFCSGKERDAESGNDFFGARYYYNGSGRWLGVDPVFAPKFDPQRLNGYRYALNDPINIIDSSGGQETCPPTFVCPPGAFCSCVTGPLIPPSRLQPSEPSGTGQQTARWDADDEPVRSTAQILLQGLYDDAKHAATKLTSNGFTQDCLASLSNAADLLPVGGFPGGVLDINAWAASDSSLSPTGAHFAEQNAINTVNLGLGLTGDAFGLAGLPGLVLNTIIAAVELGGYNISAQLAGFDDEFKSQNIFEAWGRQNTVAGFVGASVAFITGHVGNHLGVGSYFANQVEKTCGVK